MSAEEYMNMKDEINGKRGWSCLYHMYHVCLFTEWLPKGFFSQNDNTLMQMAEKRIDI